MLNTSTIFVLTLIIIYLAAATTSNQYDINDGVCKSVVEIQGYTCHEHTVTTQDGYILSLQRIPNSRSSKLASKPPVLLQHGLLLDAVSWLLNPPNQSLAYILADNGFDVWMANTRGTKYSPGHVSLSPDDPDYWKWSWDELAAYDLPASVQLVYDQTGQQKMHYVGHSMGTLTVLAAFSQGKLLSMIRSAALLSPIAHLGFIASPILKIVSEAFLAEDLYHLGLYQFDPRWEIALEFLEKICETHGLNCFDFTTLLTGENCCINPSEAASFLENEPQPTATKNLVHFAQMIRTGKMAMYDYGNKKDNTKHYHQPEPPIYELQNISSNLPLFLSHGGKDFLSDVKDVEILLDDLKHHSCDSLVVHYIENYAHIDFILGESANRLVYDPVMDFFMLH